MTLELSPGLIKTLRKSDDITDELLGERVFPIPVKTHGHFDGLHVNELIDVLWLSVNIQYERGASQRQPLRMKMMWAQIPSMFVSGNWGTRPNVPIRDRELISVRRILNGVSR